MGLNLESKEAPSFPVRGGPGPPEGYWGVWPLSFGPTHLCKHHVWPPQRGPAMDLDMDMQATVVLICTESLMLGASVENSIRGARLVLTTCCLKDNIAPCKQAADRLEVTGQEWGRGANAGTIVAVSYLWVNECLSCLQGHWISNTFSQSKPFELQCQIKVWTHLPWIRMCPCGRMWCCRYSCFWT